MDEKRRAKRLPAELRLGISSLFKQDNIKVELADETIEVINVSKGGLAFLSRSVLPIGYYFNARLRLSAKEEAKLYCVVKIIRQESHGEDIMYGCEFVGFPSVLEYIFDEYEAELETEDQALTSKE